MSYQSEYTGAQMEKVFSRVTNIVTGTVTFTATDTSYTYQKSGITGHENINYKVFVQLRLYTAPTAATATAVYVSSQDRLTVSLRDLYPGMQYTFDYMLIE